MHPPFPGITERRDVFGDESDDEIDTASHRIERAVTTISGVRCSYEV